MSKGKEEREKYKGNRCKWRKRRGNVKVETTTAEEEKMQVKVKVRQEREREGWGELQNGWQGKKRQERGQPNFIEREDKAEQQGLLRIAEKREMKR